MRRALLASLVALALAALASAAAASSVEDDLAGRWPLDVIDAGTRTPDASPNGHPAVVSATRVVPGRFGSAFRFDGAGASVRIRDAASLRPRRVTAMAWIRKNEAFPNGHQYVLAQGAHDCTAASYALYTGHSNGMRFYVRSGGFTWISPDAGSGVWEGDRWHAVAGTYDGKVVRLYVDGDEVGEGTPTTGEIAYDAPLQDFTIGTYPRSCEWGGPIDATIDEVRVYPRALSAEEIRKLQTTTDGSPPGVPAPPPVTPPAPPAPQPPPPSPSPPPSQPALQLRSALVRAAPSKTVRGAAWISAGEAVQLGPARIARYDWDLDANGTYETVCGAETSAISVAFPRPGARRIGLQVTDAEGHTARLALTTTAAYGVGGARPATTVATCENPGAGNQPDRADCIKTFAFGVVSVNSRGADDACFELTARIRAGAENRDRRTPTARGAVPYGGKLAYHARIKGSVALNGIFLPIPAGVATEYDSGEATIGLGTVRPRIGRLPVPPLPLSLTVTPDRYGRFTLADFKTPSGGALDGFPLAGIKIVLVRGGSAEITARLQLPNIFSFGNGSPAQGEATIRTDNVRGFDLEGARLGPIPYLFVGPLEVRDLFFAYDRSDERWQGGAQIPLYPGSPIALNAVPPPPDSGFGMRRGRFERAGAKLAWQRPPYPQIFPGVGLTSIGFALGVNPTRFTGSAAINALQGLIEADGELFAVFPSHATPYDVPDRGLGPSLSPLAGRRLETTTFSIGGTVKLNLPIGQVPLGDAHLVYGYPDYVKLGGGFSFGDGEYFELKGGVSGFAAVGARRFNLEGGLDACVKKIMTFCKSTKAIVSSQGIGFCAVVPVPIGGGVTVPTPVSIGYRWGDDTPDISVFTCELDKYREADPQAASRFGTLGASASRSFRLPAGLPSAMIRLRGASDAPRMLLTGPRGERILLDAAGGMSGRDTYVARDPETRTTFVALRAPSAGVWTVSALSGATPITALAVAHGQRRPSLSGTVTATGSGQRLRYRIDAPGRTVTFVERGAGVYRVIGGGRQGRHTLTFRPAPSRPQVREIVALVERQGIPVESRVITRFRVAALAARRPARLRVVRAGAIVRVSWQGRRAQRYAVTLATSTGERTLQLVRRSRVAFAGIPRNARVTVTVAALSLGAPGPASRAQLRPQPIPTRRSP